MRLNKFASWGVLPAPAGVPRPGPQSLRARLNDIAAPLRSNVNLGPRIDALAQAVGDTNANSAIDRLSGTLAPVAQLPTAIADLIHHIDAASQQNASELGAIREALEKLGEDGLPPLDGPPSRVAWEIVGCLGQVSDALCDRKEATPEKVNAQLERAKHSRCAQEAASLLADVGDGTLGQALVEQYAPFDDAGDFETERRVRLAELVRFEWLLLATLDDTE